MFVAPVATAQVSEDRVRYVGQLGIYLNNARAYGYDTIIQVQTATGSLHDYL